MSHTVHVLCKNLCELGEGPCWDDVNQRLLFVDIDKATVHRYDYATSTLQAPIEVTDPYVSAVVPWDKGGLAVAAYHRFASLDESSGTMMTLGKEVDTDNSLVKLNDGKCDPAGRFWAGSGGTQGATGENLGSLYTLNTDRSVVTKKSGIGLSNGISWSPDGRKMYYIDTPTYIVVAYDFDVSNGAISNPQTLVKIDKWIDGTPDGQCSDANGNLWISMYGGGRIIKVDAATGKKVQRLHISTSALKTTSCCFGGPNLDELFVTSASSSDPIGDAGSLFKVTGLGVKGRPSTPYKGVTKRKKVLTKSTKDTETPPAQQDCADEK